MGKKIKAIFRQLIFKTADRDPQDNLYHDDEITREMAKFPSHAAAVEAGFEYEDADADRDRRQSDVEEDEDKEDDVEDKLQLVLDFYDADYLLPFAERVIWLSNIKEAVGHVPFELSHAEIVAMVILQAEVNMKSQQDINESKRQGNKPHPTSSTSSSNLHARTSRTRSLKRY